MCEFVPLRWPQMLCGVDKEVGESIKRTGSRRTANFAAPSGVCGLPKALRSSPIHLPREHLALHMIARYKASLHASCNEREMDCPTCHTPMRSGRVTLEYTLSGFLSAGLSSLDLFFREPDAERVSIMGDGEGRIASYCS